ncbi:MAG: cytochrome c biogenesis protein CcsA [Planctomycetota bacterium]
MKGFTFKRLEMMASALVFLLGMASPGRTLQAEEQEGSPGSTLDISRMADLVVMANGRMKPLATHARESVREFMGGMREFTASPMAVYVSLLFEPQSWQQRKWIKAGQEIANEMFQGRMLLSPADVVDAHKPLSILIRKSDSGGGTAKGMTLAEQAGHLLNCAFTFGEFEEALRLLPAAGPDSDEWVSVKEMREARKQNISSRFDDLFDAYSGLKAAYLAGDSAAFNNAVDRLLTVQRNAAGRSLLSKGRVSLENLYYAVDVRLVGLILFSLAGVFFIVSLFFGHPLFRRLALAGILAGIAWNFWVIGGRTAIGERLPLKNLNEVFLVVLFFVPLIGQLLERIFKNSLYVGVSALLSVVGYIGALNLDAKGFDITPLVAILISPWREIHILTIMLSYAILLVSFGLDVGYLLLLFVKRMLSSDPDRRSSMGATADDLHHKAYLVLAWGFLFLTVGITTGAAWAHSSWGRYWGWDPKEVWATVAWAIYALFLHLRLFFKVPKAWLAVINLIGFAAIMFTYFGVTYLLSGLHAYR